MVDLIVIDVFVSYSPFDITHTQTVWK